MEARVACELVSACLLMNKKKKEIRGMFSI